MKYSPKEKANKNQKIENLLSNYKKIWGNEQAQDENKDIFNSYFVPREEIDILKDSEQKFIILNAYKGTGKSAAFIDAANSLNPEKDLVILKYDSTIIPTHGNSDFNNWICLWRQKIAECIALELINQENWKWDLKDLKEKLKSITLIIHALNKGYSSSIFSLISAIKLSSSVEIKTLDINDIEILAKNYIGKKSVWLFLDEMDQNFCAFNDSERVKIAALLKASHDMTKFFSDLKIRISIRPNVLSVLQKEYSCLSGLRQYIVNLDWNTNLLKKILSKRIESYLQRENIKFSASSEDSFINLLFDGEFDLGKGKRQVSQFISKLSFERPRWMIELCKLASKNALTEHSSYINQEHFYCSMKKFGELRCIDLSAEFNSNCKNIDKIITGFSHAPRLFRDAHNLIEFIKKNILPLDIELYKNHKPTAKEIISLLYETNFIQAREEFKSKGKNHKTQIKYNHIYYADNPSIVPAYIEHYSWEIHPIFKQYLSLTDKNDQEYLLKPNYI